MPERPLRHKVLVTSVWAGLCVVSLWLLARTALSGWFRSDDFALLLLVKRPAFDPWTSLWPIAQRYWWAYRPLGTDLYFALCEAWFGLDARGFHLLTLLVHLANALLLGCFARVLGLARWPARLAGFFYFAAPVLSLHLMRAATFHYQAATFFSLLALLLQRSRARRAGAGSRWLSVGAFGLGLLCNRSAWLVVPLLMALPVIDAKAGQRGRGLRAGLWVAAPYAVLGGLLLLADYALFPKAPDHPHYGVFLDRSSHRRLGQLVRYLVGDWPGTWICLSVVAVVAFVGADRGRPSAPVQRVRRFAGLWLVLSLAAASVLFYLPHVRFTFVAVAPACLLLAGLFEQGVAPAFRPVLALVACALWLPVWPLWQRAEAPIDAPLQAAYRSVRAHNPGLSRPIVIAYGGPDLADDATLARYRLATYRFAHLRLVAPRARLQLEVRPVQALAAEPKGGAQVWQLLPDMRLVRAAPN